MSLNNSLSVLAVPAFADNYLWLIHNGIHAAVIDPGDAIPIFEALDRYQLSLVAILLTHHHADHVGGVQKLLEQFNIPVFGPRHEAISGITIPLNEGQHAFITELDLTMQVLDVPGHTRGHIAYVAPQHNWLFCGDTLFAGGCGRLFEGSPTQMLASLSKLAALPDNTQVFCAHEYTLSNLRFAHEVEPGNTALIDRIQAEQAKCNAGKPTVPTTIGLEKATNPFLRCTEPAIVSRLVSDGLASRNDPVEIFAALREWKNSYKS